MHNKNEERANGHHNGGTRPKEVKHDGIDASWEENIVSDDSIIGHSMLEAAPMIIHFISASFASNSLPV